MFYISEENFIDKFIATLKMLNVSSIPFDNCEFYSGVECMKHYFQDNRQSFGCCSDEISMLFIKNPFEGVFSRFRDAISEQNGWYISFENPEYINGIIKITTDDAKRIISNDNLAIPQNCLYNITVAFCEGANIPYQ